jgi:hypothetical protein
MDDKVLIVLIKKIINLFPPDTSVKEMIGTIRLAVEHEADARASASFIVTGLSRKCVFEYAKREISSE